MAYKVEIFFVVMLVSPIITWNLRGNGTYLNYLLNYLNYSTVTYILSFFHDIEKQVFCEIYAAVILLQRNIMLSSGAILNITFQLGQY